MATLLPWFSTFCSTGFLEGHLRAICYYFLETLQEESILEISNYFSHPPPSPNSAQPSVNNFYLKRLLPIRSDWKSRRGDHLVATLVVFVPQISRYESSRSHSLYFRQLLRTPPSPLSLHISSVLASGQSTLTCRPNPPSLATDEV